MDQYLKHPQVVKLITKIEDLHKDLPHLPANWIDFLVKVAPWLVGLSGVLLTFSALQSLSWLLGMKPAILDYVGYEYSTALLVVNFVFEALIAYMMLTSFKLLKNMKYDGWLRLFWITLLGTVQSVLTLVMYFGGLVGTVIGLALSWYILFEIKPGYLKKSKKK